MKHVVHFSGGTASWMASKRVIAEHGRDDVTLLFADTKTEDCDLYRFLDDAEENLGVKITRLAEGRDIWQVFHDVRFIGNSRVDPCSRILKREVLDTWRSQNCTPEDSIHYIGYDWSEGHRAEKLRKYIAPWRYDFPLFKRPLLTKHAMIAAMKAEGLMPPRLYDMGFEHNNCGGFCVKAGHGHFRHLLKTMPERYLYHEQQEEILRQKLGDVAILRDRSGGSSRPLTLRELRERLETSGNTLPYEEHWGGCGCATDYGPDDQEEMPDMASDDLRSR